MSSSHDITLTPQEQALIMRQWKNLSNQCFLCNCNEAV